MKLSIIIPVYNTEKYIEKCIRSIEKQDINSDEYEVLIINDGSSDKSTDIIKQLQKEYLNIEIYNQKNGGQSSARNLGMNYAKGEYIWFIDSDDYIKENILSFILNIAYANNLDFLSFDILVTNSLGEKIERRYENKQIPQGIIKGLDYVKHSYINISPWAFICKKEIYQKNKIQFINGIIHEDYEFCLHLYQYCNRMQFIEKIVYIYIEKDEGSTTSIKTPSHFLKRIHSWQTILSTFQTRYKNSQNEYVKAIRPWINTFKIQALNLLLTAPISIELKNNEYQIFKRIKALQIKGKNNVPYPGKIKSYFFRYPIFYQIMLKTYSYIHSKYKA